MLLCSTSKAQNLSVSLGIQAGMFNAGTLENNMLFNDDHELRFAIADSKPAWGLSLPIYFKDYLRIEAAVISTQVQNQFTELVEDKVYYGTLSYGKRNYQLTISPAYSFRIKGVRPYIGAELGVSIPQGAFNRSGYITGGRVGIDAEIVHNLFITGSFSIGKIFKPSIFDGGKASFSYNKLMFGLNYTLSRPDKKKTAVSAEG